MEDKAMLARRSLWPDDEVEVRSDGFLVLKQTEAGSENEQLQDQPLLLHSTSRLLRGLYPSLDNLDDIFVRRGYRMEPERMCNDEDDIVDLFSNLSIDSSSEGDDEQSNDGVSAEKGQIQQSNIPKQYQCYQDLVRLENVSNWIDGALNDIMTFRHRTGPKKPRISRDHVKVRALEHQQKRLLQRSSESDGVDSKNGNQSQIDSHLQNKDGKDEDDEKSTSDTSVPDTDEPSRIIRLVRTVNSVRALFPHLLPILNHPRRNDKNLRIKKTSYNHRKRGAMCWLVGTMGFDITSSKQIKVAQDNVRRILEGFIQVDLAKDISNDPLGAESFWSSSWIEHLLERCNPSIPNPMELLSSKLKMSQNDLLVKARDCDNLINFNLQVNESPAMYKQYQRTVSKLHQRLSTVMAARFRGARVSIYGSCLSQLSLGKGSDVDLSLWIPEAEMLTIGFRDGSINAKVYEKKMKDFVFQATRKLRHQNDFANLVPVTRARIPVIMGRFLYADNPYTEDGGIDFDVCFLNDIAVANSGLIREYSLIDSRVRTLMITVKQFAKDNKINSAKDNRISSYTWMNLVIFYLQCLGLLPNLQSQALMKKVGLVPDPENNYWHSVNNLDTCSLTSAAVKGKDVWTMPKELIDIPVIALLYGFFDFYGTRFPSGMFAISIKQGDIIVSRLATRKVGHFFSIEDPFETYDSHCPHDLGTPCSEMGARRIVDCIRDGQSCIAKVLSGSKSSQGGLWPNSHFEDLMEPTASNMKTHPGKHQGDSKTAGQVISKSGQGRGKGGHGQSKSHHGGRGSSNNKQEQHKNNNQANNIHHGGDKGPAQTNGSKPKKRGGGSRRGGRGNAQKKPVT